MLGVVRVGETMEPQTITIIDEREDPEADWYQFWVFGITEDGTRVWLRGEETHGDALHVTDMEAQKPKNRKRFIQYMIEEWL